MATHAGAQVTVEYFREQMRRLNGLKFAPADLNTHWEGLRELPDDVLEAAVGRAIKVRIEFPSPLELRQDADQVRPRTPTPDRRESAILNGRTVAIENPFSGAHHELHIDRVWVYYCESCGDSGMREWWCGPKPALKYPWMERRACTIDNCKKLGDGYGHSWVEPCVCIDTNPEIKRRKERDAKYAAERATTR